MLCQRPYQPGLRGRLTSGTRSASPSRWDNNYKAVVTSPHPFDCAIASNTCMYCSQLVTPANLGTLVDRLGHHRLRSNWRGWSNQCLMTRRSTLHCLHLQLEACYRDKMQHVFPTTVNELHNLLFYESRNGYNRLYI